MLAMTFSVKIFPKPVQEMPEAMAAQWPKDGCDDLLARRVAYFYDGK
jgi:hypothetical protein